MGEKETLGASGRQQSGGGAIAIGEEGVQRSAAGGGGIAIDEEGLQRTAGGSGYVQDNSPNVETERRKDEGSKDAERASNLNLSKSNIDRLAGGDPGPEEAAKVKGSKSNTSERVGDPGAGSPEPTEASNLNSSKSN